MDLQAKLAELIVIVSRDVTQFLTDLDCVRKCAETIRMVSSRKDIEAICLHEAGHFAEHVRLGSMVGFTEREIRYHAPRVIYCPEKMGADRFEPNPGSIYTPFDAQKITWELPILEQVARVAVAGGVYAHALVGRPIDEGTGGDRETYKNYYRSALKVLHAHPKLLIASKLCSWAIAEVQRDLKEHPELEDHARKKASQFTQDHYGPFLEYCDLIRL
jgi:hypothetical protein